MAQTSEFNIRLLLVTWHVLVFVVRVSVHAEGPSRGHSEPTASEPSVCRAVREPHQDQLCPHWGWGGCVGGALPAWTASEPGGQHGRLPSHHTALEHQQEAQSVQTLCLCACVGVCLCLCVCVWGEWLVAARSSHLLRCCHWIIVQDWHLATEQSTAENELLMNYLNLRKF